MLLFWTKSIQFQPQDFFCVQFLFFSGSNLVTTFAIKIKNNIFIEEERAAAAHHKKLICDQRNHRNLMKRFHLVIFFQKTEIVWKKASKFAFLQRKRSQNNSASSIFFSLKIIIFGANFETFFRILKS